MELKFTKMQAFGNDYIYINTLDQDMPPSLGDLARHVSDIHYGIGSDGLVLICPSAVCEFRMRHRGRNVRQCFAQHRKIRL